MRDWRIILVLAWTCLLGSIPAAAETTDSVAKGFFLSQINVGKQLNGSCTLNDQSGTPTGNGLGVPLQSGNKSGWWKITIPRPGSIFHVVPHSQLHGTPTLVMCGRMSPLGSAKKMAVGAACQAWSAHEGFGTLTAGSTYSKRLRNIQFLIAPGSVTKWTARTVEQNGEAASGHLVGYLYGPTLQACLSKSGSGQSKTGGATEGIAAGTFTMVN